MSKFGGRGVIIVCVIQIDHGQGAVLAGNLGGVPEVQFVSKASNARNGRTCHLIEAFCPEIQVVSAVGERIPLEAKSEDSSRATGRAMTLTTPAKANTPERREDIRIRAN